MVFVEVRDEDVIDDVDAVDAVSVREFVDAAFDYPFRSRPAVVHDRMPVLEALKAKYAVSDGKERPGHDACHVRLLGGVRAGV